MRGFDPRYAGAGVAARIKAAAERRAAEEAAEEAALERAESPRDYWGERHADLYGGRD